MITITPRAPPVLCHIQDTPGGVFPSAEMQSVYSSIPTDWARLVGWLCSWILWHINPCRLFNIKSCFYIHIQNICFANEFFISNNFQQTRAHLFTLSERFQIVLFNTNSFIGTQLNDFKYCYVILIIKFNFVCSQLNVLKKMIKDF